MKFTTIIKKAVQRIAKTDGIYMENYFIILNTLLDCWVAALHPMAGLERKMKFVLQGL